MIRIALLAAAAWLGGCAEPPPQPQVDGEIVRGAIELAQARVDKAERRESRK